MNDLVAHSVSRLPYANTRDPAVRNAIGELVRGVHDMVVYQVCRHFEHAPWQERDDVVAATEAHLAVYAAPRFDPSRAKWSTFAYAAIINQCRAKLRRKIRQRKRPQEASIIGDEAEAPCQDRRIETIARAILREPRRFGMTDKQVQVFRAVTSAGPNVQLKDVAAALGYSSPSSLSDMLGRIKAVITAIDIEDFSDDAFCDGKAMAISADHLSDRENTGHAA